MRLSIRLVLILGVIGLQTVTVSAILITAYTTSEEALLRHGRDLIVHAALDTTTHIAEQLEPVAHIAEVTEGLFKQSILQADDQASLERYFLESMELIPWVSGLYVGKPDGGFVFVTRSNEVGEGGYLTKTVNVFDDLREVHLVWRDSGFAEGRRAPDPGDTFDPRLRPWYKGAMAVGGQTWTDPYVFYTSKRPGLTVAQPLVADSGEIVGVVGVDIEISQLSRFLAQLRVAEHGRALVVTRRGDVIAYPELTKVTRPVEGAAEHFRFARIDELGDPVGQAAIEALRGLMLEDGFDETAFTTFYHGREKYLAAFSPFPNDQWPWIVAVFAPDNDFLGFIRERRLFSLYLAIAIAVFACVVGVFVARRIAAPMVALAGAARQVKERRFDAPPLQDSRIADVADTLAAFRDMTQGLEQQEQRNAELNKGLHKLSRAIEQSPAAIFITDTALRVEYANPACAELSGYANEEILGRQPRIFTGDDVSDDEAAAIWEHVKAGEAWRGEVTRRRKDGEARRIFALLAPLRSESGGITNWIGWVEDVTQKHEAEEKLQRAQRMELLGQLTGGVAHDFNNLLSVTLGNLEILNDRIAGDSTSKAYVEMALRATRRSSELTQRLLAFSRRQPLTPTVTDVNAVVSGLSDLMSQTFDETYKLQIHLAEGSCLCVIDAGQLENALLNLAVNARDAMPYGGTLTIETGKLRIEEGESGRYGGLEPGCYLSISVTDEGSGMTPEVLDRAFEPFFTTKRPGGGSGLGLSMVYGFVEQSGGYVEIRSEERKGTTLRLYLPRASSDTTLPATRPDERAWSGFGETVLVVEDDPDVRATTASMLKDLGYDVQLSANGSDALARLAADPNIDLLLTDVVLTGGLSGFQLAREARQRYPGIKIVCMSGYAKPAADDDGETNDFPLLAKPFDLRELGRQIREALAPRRAAS